MICYSICFIYIVIVVQLSYFTYCSLLSRLKNPYQYNSNREVKILPHDYEDVTGLQFTTIKVSGELYSDIYMNNVNSEGDEFYTRWSSVHYLFSYRPTKPVNETTKPVTESLWHSTSIILLETESISDNLWARPTQANLGSRRTWRPYFPIISRTKNTHTTLLSAITNKQSAYLNLDQKFSLSLDGKTTLKVTDGEIFRVISRLASNVGQMNSDVKINIMQTPTPTQNPPSSTRLLFLRLIYHDKNVPSNSSTYNGNPFSWIEELNNKWPIYSSKSQLRAVSARCFQCGIEVEKLGSSECYDTFQSPDHSNRYKRAKMKTVCKGDPYTGGCFKRFLDIGTNYYERGCRANPPVKGGTYATGRYQKLEKLLKDIPEACVSSPAASLVPFSKAVSLYAYFHVCVCNTSLCNSGNSLYSCQVICRISISIVSLIVFVMITY